MDDTCRTLLFEDDKRVPGGDKELPLLPFPNENKRQKIIHEAAEGNTTQPIHGQSSSRPRFTLEELWGRYDPSKGISGHDSEELKLVESQVWKRKPDPVPYRRPASPRNSEDGDGENAVKKDEWDEKFAQVQKFKDKFGHTAVPPLCPDDPDLAKWTQLQRQLYRETIGSNNTFRKPGDSLERSRLKRLQSIDFVWDYGLFSWDAHYNHLKQQLLLVSSSRSSDSHSNDLTNTKRSARKLELSKDMKDWIQSQITCLENPFLISKERQEKLQNIFIDLKGIASNLSN